MGRGRGKKKPVSISNHENPGGSGGEETNPAYKRRGRTQHTIMNEVEEDGVEKIEEKEPQPASKGKTVEASDVAENGKKRKRSPQIKKNLDSNGNENGGPRSIDNDSAKPNGFRKIGNRRKSKPCRAAGAVIECK